MSSTTVHDVWDLQANTSWLVTARGRLTTLATTLADTAGTVGSTREDLAQHWEGAHAASYHAYAPGLKVALERGSDLVGRVEQVLQGITSVLDDAQADLDTSYVRAGARCTSVSRADGQVTFSWAEEEDRPTEIDGERATAGSILSGVRESLGRRAGNLSAVGTEAGALADAWAGPAGGTPAWDHPTGVTYGIQQTTLGDTTTVTTGDLDTDVQVLVDPDTGETALRITHYTQDQCIVEDIRIPAGQDVVINTGSGDDTISVPPGVDVSLRFSTGDGDDTVTGREATGPVELFAGAGDDIAELGSGDDTVLGGDGDDYVDSGGGDDQVFGGLGNDILYGMGGDDVISGGEGHDYLEGASGDDTLFGGDGDDIVSGGFGDDLGLGGRGDDTLYAGSGDDTFAGGAGDDTVTGEDGDDLVGEERIVIEIPAEEHYTRWLEFEVDGSDAFRERMLADLQMMASSETGQAMLEAQGNHYDESGFLGMGKDRVVLRELDEQNGFASHGPDGYAIEINPTYQGGINNTTDPQGWSGKPPIVVLFHEMGHINQYRSQGGGSGHWTDPGTGERFVDENGEPLIERQNVGLPWDTGIVPEADGEDYDFDLTENGFREEIGIPRREWY
ncbi:M91 family zinc metallopeptidase [Ornithinimicrobium sp. LYQ92]|uniref:M91 family zinc metallopeptidase n=1 Tax=Serinicoccus sp. LYQ92 TaxID=3378798 RepID=UPI0038531B24